MNKKQIAKLLIAHGCLQLNPKEPFTYASGLKGPLYCDNRQILSIPAGRKIIIEHFLKVIGEDHLTFDHLAGLATGGIPHAAILADRLNASLIYIRAQLKSHGRQNQIEGKTKAGDKILLVEDLVNQGSSLNAAIEAARAAQLKMDACLCIVDYQMAKARDVLTEKNIQLYSLTDFSTILQVAQEDGVLSSQEISLVQQWHRDPTHWQ